MAPSESSAYGILSLWDHGEGCALPHDADQITWTWDRGKRIWRRKGEPIMLQLPVSLGKPRRRVGRVIGGVCFARCGCFSFAPGRAGLRADGLRGGGWDDTSHDVQPGAG